MNHVIACGWYALADANRGDAGHGSTALTLLFNRIGSEQVLKTCFCLRTENWPSVFDAFDIWGICGGCDNVLGVCL